MKSQILLQYITGNLLPWYFLVTNRLARPVYFVFWDSLPLSLFSINAFSSLFPAFSDYSFWQYWFEAHASWKFSRCSSIIVPFTESYSPQIFKSSITKFCKKKFYTPYCSFVVMSCSNDFMSLSLEVHLSRLFQTLIIRAHIFGQEIIMLLSWGILVGSYCFYG